jgi:hypothetical protein
LVKSLMTSAAIIKPATAGTKAVLPGMSRRSVHLCFAPGGQIQWLRQLMLISSMGRMGGSSDHITFKRLIPRFFSSRRITRASGQVWVLVMSEM